MKERRIKVLESNEHLSKRLKSKILGVNLSSCYLKLRSVDADTVTLMNEIQDIYSLRPF